MVLATGRNWSGFDQRRFVTRVHCSICGQGSAATFDYVIAICRSGSKTVAMMKIRSCGPWRFWNSSRQCFGALVGFSTAWAQLFVIPFTCNSADVESLARLKVVRQEPGLHIQSRLSPNAKWTDLARYVLNPSFRPYFHPVWDPSGRVVLTQDRPADHPWQHGIFTGFHQVNGFNYWKEDQGKQRFVRLLDLKDGTDHVAWRALTEWVNPAGQVILEEENGIRIYAPESVDHFAIDFDLLLRAKSEMVQFGKFFVGGLAVRMPWDTENPRHTHLNSNGLRGRECEQKRAAWCTVERPFGDERFGIAVFDHPTNENHPPGWRVDEQGLINPNISALNDWSIPAGEERRFRYRLLIYRGRQSSEDLAKRFQVFAAEPAR